MTVNFMFIHMHIIFLRKIDNAYLFYRLKRKEIKRTAQFKCQDLENIFNFLKEKYNIFYYY